MRKLTLALATAAMAMPAALPTPAMARHYHDYHHRYADNYYHGRTWRDDRGRIRCRRSNGTTGLLIGAAGGALAGRAIDSHGDRTVGTLLGAAVGGVAGREIDRGGSHCR